MTPYLLPEQSRMVDAPLPKLVVRWKVQFVFPSYLFLKSIELGTAGTRVSPKLRSSVKDSVLGHICSYLEQMWGELQGMGKIQFSSATRAGRAFETPPRARKKWRALCWPVRCPWMLITLYAFNLCTIREFCRQKRGWESHLGER